MTASYGYIVKDMLAGLTLGAAKEAHTVKVASNIFGSDSSGYSLAPTIAELGIKGLNTTTKLDGNTLKLIGKACQTMAIHIVSLEP